ncbi:hypothetical protein BJY04DRAFT_91205 [Aspergillus karnatakaensis]|uniref:SRPBCC domain-containing protein n=1 Tax=Aspergillus karnatakaensis TaxID=1810916 RepID=UPI003CCDF1AD
MTPQPHPDTPNIPSSSAILAIQSSILIDAPIDAVWNTLVDTATWPRWNRFVPRVVIRDQPGGDSGEHSGQDDREEGNTVLEEGSRITFLVNMYPERVKEPQADSSGLRETFIKVTECQPPAAQSVSSQAQEKRKGRIVWGSDPDADGYVMSSLLMAERVHEVSEVEVEVGGQVKRMTEVRNWESQVGYLAYVVRWMFGERLRGNFEIWEAGLREFVEENI